MFIKTLKMVFPLCGMKSFHYLYTQIAGRQQQFQWQVNLRVAIAEQFFVDDWKIQSELTPRANVSLTPENFLILTP